MLTSIIVDQIDVHDIYPVEAKMIRQLADTVTLQ
jgi:hypothetical protein